MAEIVRISLVAFIFSAIVTCTFGTKLADMNLNSMKKLANSRSGSSEQFAVNDNESVLKDTENYAKEMSSLDKMKNYNTLQKKSSVTKGYNYDLPKGGAFEFGRKEDLENIGEISYMVKEMSKQSENENFDLSHEFRKTDMENIEFYRNEILSGAVSQRKFSSSARQDIPIRCGQTVKKLERGVYSFTFYINTNNTRCSIYVDLTRQFPSSKVFFSLRYEIARRFGKREILKIVQGESVQRYTNGNFYITELPSESRVITVDYENLGQTTPDVIDIPIILKIKRDFLSLFSTYDQPPYKYEKLLKHWKTSLDNERTFNPRHAEFQPCPNKCGYNFQKFKEEKWINKWVQIKEVPNYVRVEVRILRMDNSRDEMTCGGTILNARTVLTAASCVRFPDERTVLENTMEVYAGDTDDFVDEVGEQRLSVSRTLAHPKYKVYNDRATTHFNNIALIFLEDKIVFGRRAAPICLPAPGSFVNHVAYIYGFKNNLEVDHKLQTTPISYGHYTDTEIGDRVYGRSLDDRYSCGDIGSPAIIRSRNYMFVVGILTETASCDNVNEVNTPDLLNSKRKDIWTAFTNVSMHLDFIQQHLGEDHGRKYC